MTDPAARVRLDQFRAPGAAAGRHCGGCSACCVVLPIAELRKPARRACDHVTRNGCRIHPERPSSCRAFHCLWLRGAIGVDETTRPDALGVMFDDFTTRGTSDEHLLAFELWPDALSSPDAVALLDALRLTRPVRLSRRDGTWDTLDPTQEQSPAR